MGGQLQNNGSESRRVSGLSWPGEGKSALRQGHLNGNLKGEGELGEEDRITLSALLA